MSVDQYPLPKPQDLFATLSGGEEFTTLDLSQAYLQLQLDDESQKLVVVNTHKGLYKFKRLPFGVASACTCYVPESNGPDLAGDPRCNLLYR
jgi:hypothetical protein